MNKDSYLCGMIKTDFIIVGCGLAGIAFCEHLRHHQKSFVVVDDGSQLSSIVAAGLYNPVILKRFTPVWKAKEQLELALPLYQKIEHRLNIKIDYSLKIYRRLASIEEQNLWYSATDHPLLETFLSNKIIENTIPHIDAPFGYGEVFHAGRLDTNVLIEHYKKDLKQNEKLIEERFNYDGVKFLTEGIGYQGITARHIVFAEGFGLKYNPYFKDIPLKGTKGEVIIIKAPKLKMDHAIKSSVFVIPTGNDLYAVGSTYNHRDKSNIPTTEGLEELTSKLSTFLRCDFEVVEHLAGVRPTVKDRRPLIGQHPDHQNLYVLNGLGTRGVMIAPFAARSLYEFIFKGTPIDDEMNITRFSS